jgi:hypothetical protein
MAPRLTTTSTPQDTQIQSVYIGTPTMCTRWEYFYWKWAFGGDSVVTMALSQTLVYNKVFHHSRTTAHNLVTRQVIVAFQYGLTPNMDIFHSIATLKRLQRLQDLATFHSITTLKNPRRFQGMATPHNTAILKRLQRLHEHVIVHSIAILKRRQRPTIMVTLYNMTTLYSMFILHKEFALYLQVTVETHLGL